MVRLRGRRQALYLLFAVAALSALLIPGPRKKSDAADHRDGTIFPNTAANGRSDINDIYVFRSPSNANNTVLVFTFQPFPGNLAPTAVDPSQQYDIRIDTNGDAVEDITFRVTYGAPDAQGVQDVTLRGLPASRFPPTGILAKGKTGQNLPIVGGGMFRSAIHDDPFVFDGGSGTAGGFTDLIDNGVVNNFTFPRAVPANRANPQPGEARNFFGPNGNTLAAIIELPSSRLAPNNALIGVYVAIVKNGAQVDRMGRPAINTALIPRVPRNNMAQAERRDEFNRTLPKNDPGAFRADMVSILENFYGRPAMSTTTLTSGQIADALLPDLLIFQMGNPNGFGTFVTSGTGQGGFFAGNVLGNGRRLRDDVIDVELSLLTGGAITTDNVPDDNGTRITDGNMGTTAAFPYIGPPNLPLNGPGTGPNP